MSGQTVDSIVLARCRLARLSRVDRQFSGRLNPAGKMMVRRCLFSSYLVMRAAGLGAEANLLVAEARG